MVVFLNTNPVTVYLGLGSNLGRKRKNIRIALTELEKYDIKVVKVSSLRTTKPVGYEDQPDFVNAVAEIKTIVSPRKLLRIVKKIEKDMGRKRTRRWGPRLIDIDILLYGDRTMNTACLTLPHPRLADRSFVLEPLREIAPKKYKKVILWKK